MSWPQIQREVFEDIVEEFGGDVLYRRGNAAPVTIRAAFDSSYEYQALGDDGQGVTSVETVLLVPYSAVAAPERDDRVTVEGVAYKVAQVHRQDPAGALLVLRKLLA
jgi:hypothetical protein